MKPSVRPAVMVSQDLRIGRCRLIEGDCLDILPSMAGVDHVITDPPYEERFHKAKAGRGPDRTDGQARLKGLDFASIDAIRGDVTAEAARICQGWFIAFCTVEGVARWADVINPSPMRYKRACIWVKPDSTPQLNGQGPAMGAECFVTAWCGSGYSKWNGGGKRGVYTHCVNVGRYGGHPTEKPLSLMREIIADFTQPHDLVLDPFMGSGTTGVACQQLGRRFIGIEQNPIYFELACRRIAEAAAQPDMFVPDHEHASQTEMGVS